MRKILCYLGIHLYKKQIGFIKTCGEKVPAYYEYQCVCGKDKLD